MNKLSNKIQRACNELGLQVNICPKITLLDGSTITADAHIPQLGGDKGMLVISDKLARNGIYNLFPSGYGVSFLREPESEDSYDIESIIEMFSDWGWSGDEKLRPSWMLDMDDEEEE